MNDEPTGEAHEADAPAPPEHVTDDPASRLAAGVVTLPAEPEPAEAPTTAPLPEQAEASRNFGPEGDEQDVPVQVDFTDGKGETIAPVFAETVVGVYTEDGDEVDEFTVDAVQDVAGICLLRAGKAGLSGDQVLVVRTKG